MTCEDCRIEMDWVKTEEMIEVKWEVYRCPRCKGVYKIREDKPSPEYERKLRDYYGNDF